MPPVRSLLVLLLLAAATGACGSRGCGRRGPTPSPPPSRPRAAPADDVDGGVQIAAPVTPRDRLPGMMVPVAVRWIFLREDPLPTGRSPDMVVGAVLPCGYAPAIATAEGWDNVLVLHVAARWAGAGPPPAQPSSSCADAPVLVDFVSPGRVRLGSYAVTDPFTPPDAGAPTRVALRVVEDNARTPRVPARRVRACTPGRDASCAAGGVCGAVPGRGADEGVCVPPLDPYLHAGRACEAGTVEVALAHQGPYPAQPAPAPGAPLRACLPECTPGAAEVGLACAPFGARWAWVPASDAVALAP